MCDVGYTLIGRECTAVRMGSLEKKGTGLKYGGLACHTQPSNLLEGKDTHYPVSRNFK
jgi:hypothetical protein